MIALYFVGALAGTWINYIELHLTSIGYYDLSINQQALSSTLHSNHPYPFYESVNCGRDGRCSFLLVHPVFLAYAVAAPYAVWPSAFTLFAIQDLALALAALPLYAIARRVTQSPRLAVVIAGVYLVWLPAFSGIFSFHWEAFIPLEFFLFFWLWLTERYRLAVPVVVVAYLTLEVMPILLFFAALYFLIPWLIPLGRLLRTEVPRIAQGDVPISAPFRAVIAQCALALRSRPRLLASLYLLIGSATAYLLLHGFVTNGGPLLGLPALPAKYVIPITRPVYAAVFTVKNLETAWQAKLVFWLVIYGTLAMLPILAPRTLVLAVPWIILSLFATSGYYRMGDQYAFVTAAVVFIGFVYGVARLKRWAETVPTEAESPSRPGSETEGVLRRTQEILDKLERLEPPPPPTPNAAGGPGSPALSASELSAWWSRRRRVARVALTVVLVGVIAFNLFLNPLNPLAAPLKVDRPFVPQSALGLTGGLSTTDYNHLQTLVRMMGADAVVAASPMLFTFVANDPYAYPLLAGMDFPLPFNTSATQYVFLVDRGGTLFPKQVMVAGPTGVAIPLKEAIYNDSFFGVRAWVPSTYIGGLLLFQRDYGGATEVVGAPPPSFENATYVAGGGLSTGPAGVLVGNTTSQSGVVIESGSVSGKPLKRETGEVFSGPGVILQEGAYSVTVALRGGNVTLPRGSGPSLPAVTLDYSGFQVRLGTIVLDTAALNSTAWRTFTFNFSLSYPVLDFTLSGMNRHSSYGFQVEYISIDRVGNA